MQTVVGVDLGGTKIQTVLLRGTEVVGRERVATPRSGPDEVIRAIGSSVRAATDGAPGVIQALGIGSPGRIDRDTGTVSLAKNVPGFTDPVELGLLLSKDLALRAPVVVDNDVRAATLGEFALGAGRPFRDLLCVFVGTGVGGGLVLGGELREGRGAAGEIGHAVVQPGGRRCSCGRKGCLEAYAGRGCMETRARRLAKRGRKTALFEIMQERQRDRLTSGVIAAALEKGDRLAEELVEEAVWALGLALASAQNVLDLEAIILGGGLGDRLGAPFVERVRHAMEPHLFVPDRPPELLGTELGDLSGAVGAAILAGRRLDRNGTSPGRAGTPRPA
jgi:glucokinase